MQAEKTTAFQDLIGRALETGKFDAVQLWFEASVLDRYRSNPDCRILRSNSAGRLRGSSGWLVNFGIAPHDSLVHLAINTLAALPDLERAHWLTYLVHPPAGQTFLRMSVNPNACIDDGPTRDW